jgi:hypothetical protein
MREHPTIVAPRAAPVRKPEKCNRHRVQVFDRVFLTQLHSATILDALFRSI